MAKKRIIVIGAGVGGLTAAAIMARSGHDVTVLEAHVYPGGCAGTFYHQKYRFDAGATLAGGFYPGGPMDLVAHAAGIPSWPTQTAEPAMQVHLPDQTPVSLWGDERRWEARNRAFGAESTEFWKWQEDRADQMWDLAMRIPPWPPQSLSQIGRLAQHATSWLVADPRKRARPSLVADAFRTLDHHLPESSGPLRLFIDAQLLISAQTTSQHANALYGASALDLPRRGVVNLSGGMKAISETLVNAIQDNGGRVLFRQEVKQIILKNAHPTLVITRKGASFPADMIIANLPDQNIATLLGNDNQEPAPPAPENGWGAFMVYLGLDETILPADFPSHHQIVAGEPLGEGNSVYLSISPSWDASRAPAGQRAVTISTHTDLRTWWQLFREDRPAYEARKDTYQEKILNAVNTILPGVRSGVRFVMPGTPVTFQRFTRRAWGWVGGVPQTSLLRASPPRISPGLWSVGDSIFPGQSVPAVALGGVRVARLAMQELKNTPRIFGAQKIRSRIAAQGRPWRTNS